MSWYDECMKEGNCDTYETEETDVWTTDEPVNGKKNPFGGFKEGWGDFKSDLASGLLDAAKGHDFFGTGSYAAQTNPKWGEAADAAKGWQQVHKLSDNFVVDYGPYTPAGAQVLQHATPPTPSFGEKALNVAGQAAVSFGTKALLGALCDERVKHDIAPLAISEVHDELAEIAFFVKELRECA